MIISQAVPGLTGFFFESIKIGVGIYTQKIKKTFFFSVQTGRKFSRSCAVCVLDEHSLIVSCKPLNFSHFVELFVYARIQNHKVNFAVVEGQPVFVVNVETFCCSCDFSMHINEGQFFLDLIFAESIPSAGTFLGGPAVNMKP